MQFAFSFLSEERVLLLMSHTLLSPHTLHAHSPGLRTRRLAPLTSTQFAVQVCDVSRNEAVGRGSPLRPHERHIRE